MARSRCTARSLYLDGVKINLGVHALWAASTDAAGTPCWQRIRHHDDLPVQRSVVIVTRRNEVPDASLAAHPSAPDLPASWLLLAGERGRGAGRAGRSRQRPLRELARDGRWDELAAACGVPVAYARLVVAPKLTFPHVLVHLDLPGVDAQVLADALWQDRPTDGLFIALGSPRAPRPFLERALADSDPQLRAWAIGNITLPFDEVRRFLFDAVEDVRFAVLARPDCPTELLSQYSHLYWAQVAVAMHHATPQEVLTRLAANDHKLHRLIAANPSTPTPLLAELAVTHPEEVARNASADTATLREVLLDATRHSNSRVAATICQRNDATPELLELAMAFPRAIPKQVLVNAPSMTTDQLARLVELDSDTPDWDVALDALEHPNCPPALATLLASDEDDLVRGTVAMHTKDPALLRELAGDDSAAVRRHAHANPHCPLDVLTTAVTQSDTAAQHGAGMNPNLPSELRLAMLSGSGIGAIIAALNMHLIPDDVRTRLFSNTADRAVEQMEPAALAAQLDAAGLSRAALDTAITLADSWSGTLGELIGAARALTS
jgi:hypothetical protein